MPQTRFEFDHLIKAFDRIGATAHVVEGPRWTIDVETTRVSNRRRGGARSQEAFKLSVPRDWEVSAVDVRPADRHLLLHVMRFDVARAQPLKYLAGHDERHWFAASIPGRPASVADAKRALMPDAVGAEVARRGVKAAKAARRRNDVFVRQGEWFFVPMPAGWTPGEALPILKNEPISRGTLELNAMGGSHWCEELVRVGVETFVSVRGHGMVKLEEALAAGLAYEGRHWVVPQFCAVRRKVRHHDHATIDLGRGWHRVHMNTEGGPGRANLLFLD